MVAPHASQDGHKITLTCKKKCTYTLTKIYIYIYIYIYSKRTYCDHSNKNVEHPDLGIAKIRL